jgi:hypothetical protein
MAAPCFERWRPGPESNRGARICSPLRHHSATGPSGCRRETSAGEGLDTGAFAALQLRNDVRQVKRRGWRSAGEA